MRQLYYSQHIFMCENVREGEVSCNADGEASRLRGHVKDRIREWGLKGPGGVRANSAGCLGRCQEGPCLVIYPDGVWYRYTTAEDLDEILFEHVMSGRTLERLRLPDD